MTASAPPSAKGDPKPGNFLRAIVERDLEAGVHAGRRFAQSQTPRSSFRANQQRTTEELLDARELRPRSRARARLTLLRPRYYRHERRLM